tara:strand:- start:8150 stop:8383 length:234 start_codon:yes stop_codon:yes gene_type:complete
MKQNCNMILCAIVVAVLLNLVVPQVLKGSGGQHSSGKTIGQEIKDMMTHHANTPVSSSIVMAVIVGVSVWVCCSVKL